MKKSGKTPLLKSLANSLDIIDFIGESGKAMTATEIANGIGASVSSVYKSLITFLEREYLSYDHITKQYRLHTKLLRFANSIYLDRSYIQTALPIMKEVAEQTKETIHFGIPEGYYGVFIEKVNSPHTIAVQTRIGTRIPFNRGATQKAMMAFLSDERFKNFCDNFLDNGSAEGRAVIETAIADRKIIQHQAYAVTQEEVNPNVAAVAAPVFGFSNVLIGSIAIAGLKDRFTEPKIIEYINTIHEACKNVSNQLGASTYPTLNINPTLLNNEAELSSSV